MMQNPMKKKMPSTPAKKPTNPQQANRMAQALRKPKGMKNGC